MKIKIICMALVIAVLAAFSGCAAGDPNKADTTEGLVTADEEYYIIETKYANLEYPDKWKDIIKTEITDEDVYSVKFFCVTSDGDVPLFNMSFNGGDGYCLGTLTVNKTDVPVYLECFEIDNNTVTGEDYGNCCAMEEDVNVIISRLVEKYGMKLSVNNEPASGTAENDSAVYPIETKFGNLSYPEKWKDLVKTEITDGEVYTVSFSGKTENGYVPIFDLNFNGGDGYLLGTMKVDGQDVSIYFNEHEIDKESMSEEEYNNCCNMCEDVNVTLEYLAKDYGFSFN